MPMHYLNNLMIFFGGICGTAISLIIILLAIYALRVIFSSWFSAKARVTQLKSAFGKYITIDSDAINKLTAEFNTNESKEIWKKFKDNLIYSTDKVGDDVFYTSYPIKDFFDLNLVGGELVSSKLIPAIPALLTGLGLLGTFWGLTNGLSGIDVNDVKI